MKAVITGDIIQSTKLLPEHRVMLVKKIQQALKVWEKDFKYRSEFFRGDSFQCYLTEPKLGLRVALLLKTYIRSLNPTNLFTVTAKKNPAKHSSVLLPSYIIDARIAVGIGEAEAASKLATSGGPAFVLSGHLLDELKNMKQTFGIATNDKYEDELETEAILLDAIIAKTSALQCQVINFKLLNYNETKIAAKLNINQSAVNQRSKGGNWNAIAAMVYRFEEMYSKD